MVLSKCPLLLKISYRFRKDILQKQFCIFFYYRESRTHATHATYATHASVN